MYDDGILVKQWKNDNNNASLKLIIDRHYKMICGIANKYSGLGIPKEDLIAEGMIGLFVALDKFQYEKNVKFSSYAYFWIKAKMLIILKTFLNKKNTCHHGHNVNYKLKEEEMSNYHTHNTDYNLPWHRTKINHNWEEYISTKLYNTQNESSNNIEQDNELIKITAIINSLSNIEREVINLRWFHQYKLSLKEIALKVNLSSERVRQIEKGLIIKIKNKFKDIYGYMCAYLKYTTIIVVSSIFTTLKILIINI